MASASATADENYDDLDEEGGLSGFWILIIFLVVLVAFAGIVWIAYQKGMHAKTAAESDLPVIAANPTPAREEVALDPVEPSRQEVFDELNEATPTRTVADIDPDADPLAGYESGSSSGEQPVDVAANDPAPVTTAPVNTSPSTTQPARQEPVPSNRQPEPAVTRPAATAANTVQTPTPSAGTHTVQVGAFGSRDEAMEFYGVLMQRHGPLVGNQAPEVRTVTVKGKDYNRLWIGQFPNRDAAAAYCQQLSAKGQDCYVQSR